MMEPVIGSTRLFAAFEQASVSPGAALHSTLGPGGSPSGELVRAFESAMTLPPGSEAVMPVDMTAHGIEPEMFHGAGSMESALPPPTSIPGPAECMPSPQGEAPFRVDGTSRPVPAMGETGVLQSPVELYRIQYQIGLLRAQTELAMKSSQSLSQSLESALKQSG